MPTNVAHARYDHDLDKASSLSLAHLPAVDKHSAGEKNSRHKNALKQFDPLFCHHRVFDGVKVRGCKMVCVIRKHLV